MQPARFNRVIATLAFVYVAYIAIALLWSRIRDTLRNGTRRNVGLLGFSIRRERSRPAHPGEPQ